MSDSRPKNVPIEAERGFSALNYLKNDFRNSIGKFIFSQNANYFRHLNAKDLFEITKNQNFKSIFY